MASKMEKGHYEYAVFSERVDELRRVSAIEESEEAAMETIAFLRRQYPSKRFFIGKRLIMAWEVSEEEGR